MKKTFTIFVVFALLFTPTAIHAKDYTAEALRAIETYKNINLSLQNLTGDAQESKALFESEFSSKNRFSHARTLVEGAKTASLLKKVSEKLKVRQSCVQLFASRTTEYAKLPIIDGTPPTLDECLQEWWAAKTRTGSLATLTSAEIYSIENEVSNTINTIEGDSEDEFDKTADTFIDNIFNNGRVDDGSHLDTKFEINKLIAVLFGFDEYKKAQKATNRAVNAAIRSKFTQANPLPQDKAYCRSGSSSKPKLIYDPMKFTKNFNKTVAWKNDIKDCEDAAIRKEKTAQNNTEKQIYAAEKRRCVTKSPNPEIARKAQLNACLTNAAKETDSDKREETQNLCKTQYDNYSLMKYGVSAKACIQTKFRNTGRGNVPADKRDSSLLAALESIRATLENVLTQTQFTQHKNTGELGEASLGCRENPADNKYVTIIWKPISIFGPPDAPQSTCESFFLDGMDEKGNPKTMPFQQQIDNFDPDSDDFDEFAADLNYKFNECTRTWIKKPEVNNESSQIRISENATKTETAAEIQKKRFAAYQLEFDLAKREREITEFVTKIQEENKLSKQGDSEFDRFTGQFKALQALTIQTSRTLCLITQTKVHGSSKAQIEKICGK